MMNNAREWKKKRFLWWLIVARLSAAKRGHSASNGLLLQPKTREVRPGHHTTTTRPAPSYRRGAHQMHQRKHHQPPCDGRHLLCAGELLCRLPWVCWVLALLGLPRFLSWGRLVMIHPGGTSVFCSMIARARECLHIHTMILSVHTRTLEEAERAPAMCLKAVHGLKLVELEVTSDKAADGLPTRADLQVTPCNGNLKAARRGRGGVAEDGRGMLRGNQESGKARCRPKNQVAILFKPQLSSASQLGQGWGQ